MHIEVVGINYKTTPAAVRSKVAIGSLQLGDALLELHRHISQGTILCTCNRTEIYSISPEEDNSKEIIEFLKSRSGLTDAKLIPYVYIYKDTEAVNHLFRVASGLDSMIIGEYEILGQVKRSLKEAEKCGFVESPLLELFRRAVSAGRKARAKTKISRNALSVSSVSVGLASQVVGDIKNCRILVIGAGEAGQQVAKASRERGASQITVASRSSRKGTVFAKQISGNWVPMQNLSQELLNCDIVICCSGAPHTILKQEMIAEAMRLRSNKPLVIVDIGIPCNVDSGVKLLKNVSLFNIDELTTITEVNFQQRSQEIQKAQQIVNTEVEKFMTYWHELKVKPLITALVTKAETIRQSRLNSTLKKVPDLSSEQRSQIEALSKSIIQKILHEPIECLKSNHKNEEYFRIVSELFCLSEEK